MAFSIQLDEQADIEGAMHMLAKFKGMAVRVVTPGQESVEGMIAGTDVLDEPDTYGFALFIHDFELEESAPRVKVIVNDDTTVYYL